MNYKIEKCLMLSIAVLIISMLSFTNVYAAAITFSDTIQGEDSGIWTGELDDSGHRIWESQVYDIGVTHYNINGFDSTLGTLDEIQFSLDVTVSGGVTFAGSAYDGGGTFTRNTWGQINLLGVGFSLVASAQTETWSMDLSDTEYRTGSGVFIPAQSIATYNLSDSNAFNSYISGGMLSIGAASALQPGGTVVNGVGSITAYSNIVTGVLDVAYIYTPFNDPPDPVPEPATLLLLGSGLAGLAFYRRKKK